MSERQIKEGWKIHKFFDRKNSIGLSSLVINKLIQDRFSDILVIINKNKYKAVYKYIDDNWSDNSKFLQYKVLQASIKNKEFTNDKKICLGSDIKQMDNNVDIYFGNYYDSVLTNEACGSIYENIVTGSKSKMLSLDSFTSENHILELSASKCNNHIGVSTIAITKDRKILLWTQNSRTMQNSNQIIPTGSGSLDFQDLINQNNSLREIVLRGTNRELKEECQINLKSIIETKVIGFWRWLERGGKPEFSSVSKLDIDASEITPDVSEAKQVGHSVYSIDLDSPKFENDLNDLLSNPNSSLPLLMKLKKYIEFIKKESLEKFIRA